MIKTAIVTAIFGDAYWRIADISIPTLLSYANRIGSVLKVLETRSHRGWSVYWEKFAIEDLLGEYDRVAWIDVDVIVSPLAPSIFEHTKVDAFSAFDEGVYFTDRAEQLTADAGFYGMSEALTKPRGFTYFNSGVMVLGKKHRKLLTLPLRPKPDSIMPEQTYLNLKLAESGATFHDLGITWNGLHSLRGPRERSDLNIVHYAGWLKTADWVDRVIAQMKRDLENWK